MCHEYGATWWQSDTKTNVKRAKNAEADSPQTATEKPNKKPMPAPEHKVEEKELIPAE